MEARFQASTCVVAIAACSLVTEMARGMPFGEARRLTPQSVAEALGGVPEERMDRCDMAVDALRSAVADCIARNGVRPGGNAGA